MERRSFLAAGAVALAPPLVAPATAGATRAGVTVLRTRVANPVGADLAPGGAAALVRQVRSFDALAVAVQVRGETVGYVQPIKAGTLAALMDAGVSAQARVVRAAPLEIEITLDL